MEISYMAAPGCLFAELKQKLALERVEKVKFSYNYTQRNIYETIIAHCLVFNGINHRDITSSSRKREIVYARQQAMYFGSKYSTLSLGELGAYFNKDHATVIHAKKSVQNNMYTDKGYREQLNQLESEIIKSLEKESLLLKNNQKIDN